MMQKLKSVLWYETLVLAVYVDSELCLVSSCLTHVPLLAFLPRAMRREATATSLLASLSIKTMNELQWSFFTRVRFLFHTPNDSSRK